MKVGIDVSQIAFSGTGVAGYTKNLVDNLLSLDKNNSYKFFGASLRRQEALKEYCRPWPIPPTILEILWNRLHVLPVENFIGPIDVFHSSDWTQPPTKAKKVTTVHDLVVYKYPEVSHPKIIAAQKRRLEWVKKECDLVIAVSQATKKDIVEILKIPEEKIRVIYEAATPNFAAVKTKVKKEYILAVGTREPRKNLGRLIQAYQLLKLKDVELAIAGNFGWGEDVKGVKCLGYVPNEKLPELYSGAKVFVYPSLYEGFGIPILEAMACGCPVVTSNVSSLPEVGGEAAIYTDPLKVTDLTEKIKYALGADRDKLAKKGFDQVKKFSWEKTAQETFEVYQSLL